MKRRMQLTVAGIGHFRQFWVDAPVTIKLRLTPTVAEPTYKEDTDASRRA